MADSIDSSVLNGARIRLEREKENLRRETTDAVRRNYEAKVRGQRDVDRIHTHNKKAAEATFSRGQREIENLKELNLKNIDNLNKLNRDKIQMLADKTRTDFENLQMHSLKQIHDFQRSNVEKFLEISNKAEDPFYKPKQFTTEIQEEEEHYDIKISLPEYEARNVGISGYSNQLKISFSRNYESDTPISPTQENSTRTHESVTETYYMPTNLNFKKVVREYSDGKLTIKVAKANPLQFDVGKA